MSSEESEFEDEQDPITGETSTKLVGFVARKLPWERTNLTNAKMRLDRAHQKNLTSHARQMAKPRRVGEDSDRPRPDVACSRRSDSGARGKNRASERAGKK